MRCRRRFAAVLALALAAGCRCSGSVSLPGPGLGAEVLLTGTKAQLPMTGGPVVLAMRDAHCPVSQRTGHALRRLEERALALGGTVLFINVNAADTPKERVIERRRFGFASPYLFDRDGAVGRVLRPRSTTEVFILDAERRLRFRGAVSLRHRPEGSNPAEQPSPAMEALEEIHQGLSVSLPVTDAPGCVLSWAEPTELGTVGWADVSDVFARRCIECHEHENTSGVSLSRYRDAYARRAMIGHVVREGLMPPWYADPAIGSFKNDLSLSEADRRTILGWVDGGAPKGEGQGDVVTAARHEPQPPTFTVTLPPVEIPAEGTMEYVYVTVPSTRTEDLHIIEFEFESTTPRHLHHAMVFDEHVHKGSYQPLNSYLAVAAPGQRRVRFAKGHAKRLRKGRPLSFQLHYQPNGEAAVDRLRLHLRTTDTPTKVVETVGIWPRQLVIPPHTKGVKVSAVHKFPRDGALVALFAHMHYRGARMQFDLWAKEGTNWQPLLNVEPYSFDWQLRYTLAKPFPIAAGSRVRIRAWFDNTAGNPLNPNPDETVRFGLQSADEMAVGYVDWVPHVGASAP